MDTNPPEDIDFSKFDVLFYGMHAHFAFLSLSHIYSRSSFCAIAFATPNSSSTLTWDSGSQAILQRLVSAANSSGAGTKIVLSVGGASSSVRRGVRLGVVWRSEVVGWMRWLMVCLFVFG